MITELQMQKGGWAVLTDRVSALESLPPALRQLQERVGQHAEEADARIKTTNQALAALQQVLLQNGQAMLAQAQQSLALRPSLSMTRNSGISAAAATAAVAAADRASVRRGSMPGEQLHLDSPYIRPVASTNVMTPLAGGPASGGMAAAQPQMSRMFSLRMHSTGNGVAGGDADASRLALQGSGGGGGAAPDGLPAALVPADSGRWGQPSSKLQQAAAALQQQAGGSSSAADAPAGALRHRQSTKVTGPMVLVPQDGVLTMVPSVNLPTGGGSGPLLGAKELKSNTHPLRSSTSTLHQARLAVGEGERTSAPGSYPPPRPT